MFDVSQRKFLLRKNFKNYGSEDRLRYSYQGDTFNAYSQRNTESVLKYGFEKESVPAILASQNAQAETNNIGDGYRNSIDDVYEFLFESKLDSVISYGLSASFSLQASLLKKISLGRGETILELGAGSGLLAPLYLADMNAIGVTYVVVEAIPQLQVLQQSVLKYFSLKSERFDYCSSLENYKELRKDSTRNIVLHISAWNLKELGLTADIVVANNVLDQVTDSDFSEYLGSLEKVTKPETKLSVWGGVEKGGVNNLYLFGFGTYHNSDVIQALSERYDLLHLKKEGSEFYALFECHKSQERNIGPETIVSIERKEIGQYLQETDFLWVDDNSPFLLAHEDLLEGRNLVSVSASVSTAPLPCGIKRTHISDRKIRGGEKILVCSYRWQRVLNHFEENGWRAIVNKISDKFVFMELTK